MVHFIGSSSALYWKFIRAWIVGAYEWRRPIFNILQQPLLHQQKVFM